MSNNKKVDNDKKIQVDNDKEEVITNVDADSPENHMVDIPEEVMDEIMRNMKQRDNPYLGNLLTWNLLVQFYADHVSFYIEFEDEEDTNVILTPDPTDVIIYFNEKRYKELMTLNRQAARDISKAIRSFSRITF